MCMLEVNVYMYTSMFKLLYENVCLVSYFLLVKVNLAENEGLLQVSFVKITGELEKKRITKFH